MFKVNFVIFSILFSFLRFITIKSLKEKMKIVLNRVLMIIHVNFMALTANETKKLNFSHAGGLKKDL